MVSLFQMHPTIIGAGDTNRSKCSCMSKQHVSTRNFAEDITSNIEPLLIQAIPNDLINEKIENLT